MEEQILKIYNSILVYLLKVGESSEISEEVNKKLFHVLVQMQMKELKCCEKIKIILENCNEHMLKSLWYNIFKNCQIFDLVNIFKNEIMGRNFSTNFLCQDVLVQYLQLSAEQELEKITKIDTCLGKNELVHFCCC